MSELYKTKGVFQSYAEKQVSATFLKKTAIIQIDNTYEGGTKGRLEDVPFEVFGKSQEAAQGLTQGTPVEVSFKIGGNNGFTRITAVFIKAEGKANDDIQF